MASIQSAGVGSGLDLESLITGLVSAEGQATAQQLNRREASYQAKLSGFGIVKSSLSQFQSRLADLKDLSDFQKRSAVSSDTAALTVTAANKAVAGEHTIEINSLAAANRLRTAGVADKDTAVGTGTLQIGANGESFEVTITSENDTLEQIRDAINDATDNVGVNASIINADDGAGGTESRLVLTSDSTGTAYDIGVLVVDADGDNTDSSGLSILSSNNLVEITASADASIVLDGQAITRSSNTISDAIAGLTLNLLEADAGDEKTITISEDKSAVRSSVNSFVDAYNALLDSLNQVTFFDSGNNRAGILIGDSSVRNLRFQLSRELGEVVPSVTSDYNSLSALGITSNEDGVYSLNNEVFSEALENNFDDVGLVFADEQNGIAVQLDKIADDYLTGSGILDNRTNGLQSSIDDISDRRVALNDRLVRIEQRFRQRFTALDNTVAIFQSTSTFLAQQLAALPGFTRTTRN